MCTRVFSLAFLFAPLLFCEGRLVLEEQKYLQRDFVLEGKNPQTLWTRSEKYVVASDSSEASQIGVRILEKNGNVADSAVAVSFAVSVLRPQSTGLGGGGFLLLHLNGKTTAFDFRERAPYAAEKNMYLESGKSSSSINSSSRASLLGAKAAGVPGTIAGLVEIHKKYGKLSLPQVMEDAIRLAENGFPVYPDLEQAISAAYKDMGPGMRAVFAPKGKLLKEKDILIQKDLAKTLRLIAKKGAAPFYSGKIAKSLTNFMRQNGGLIRMRDLNNYRVFSPMPLWSSYRGLKIASMPLPSSAVFIFNMLKFLESFPIAKLYQKQREKYYHVLLQAMGIAYQERAKYGGDPRFSSIPLQQSPQKNQKASYETTHFSIIDTKGNAVSSTQSINYRFGARVMIPGWGIVLNDTMDDFSTAPGKPNVYGLVGGDANAPAPGKTPLSSMSPVFVFDKKGIRLAVGAPGGSQIITAVLQAVVHDVDLKMHPLASAARGRIHFQFTPPDVFIEPQTLQNKEKKALKKLGYSFRTAPARSKLFPVKRDASGIVGASDPRGSGRPAGSLNE